jgi:hypothetical protein
MQAQHIDFFNLSGGMDRQKNRLALGSNEADWIENLHWASQQGWSTQNNGYQPMNTTPLNGGATVQAAFAFKDATGVEHTLLQVGDTLYRVDALGGKVLSTLGVVGSSPCQAATFGGWCYWVSPSAPPKRWNGQTPSLEAAPGWPPTIAGLTLGNPSLACTYANRLVLAGDALNPNTVFLSELENADTFTPNTLANSAGGLLVSPGDGQRITALIPLFVPYTNEQVLLIFKNRSIYALTGTSTEDFTLELVSNHVGALSSQALLGVGQEVWFLSEEGINTLGANTDLGTLALGSLSSKIKGLTETLNRSQLHRAFALQDVKRQEVWWFVPEGSSNRCNRVWVQNYGGPAHVWSLRTGIEAACALRLPTGELLTGGFDGLWYQQRKGQRYGATAPVPWVFRTPTYVLGNTQALKRLPFVDVYCRDVGLATFDVKAFWGQDPTPTVSRPQVELTASQSLQLYGLAQYGASTYASGLSSRLRVYPDGVGTVFQLELSGQTPEQPLTLEGFSFRLQGGGAVGL